MRGKVGDGEVVLEPGWGGKGEKEAANFTECSSGKKRETAAKASNSAGLGGGGGLGRCWGGEEEECKLGVTLL